MRYRYACGTIGGGMFSFEHVIENIWRGADGCELYRLLKTCVRYGQIVKTGRNKQRSINHVRNR